MSVANSMPHTENGITINFPDSKYFQFESCQAYIDIKNQGVKEMDFGWYETKTKTMWLVELKGFFNPDNPKHIIPDLSSKEVLKNKIDELCAKAIHSLCMLASMRRNTASCASKKLQKATKIKLVFLVTLPGHLLSYLSIIHDVLNSLLQPYKIIFDVSGLLVVDPQTAKKVGLNWVG